ncbi:hypothetical protein OMD49_27790 [Bacillus anthracis]|nr:hypothetical protein [Bacillus anthracis]
MQKNINAALPKQRQLSGYHLESLAIDAFKIPNHTPKTYKGMVEHFCRHAERAVLKPITEKNGKCKSIKIFRSMESDFRKQVNTLYVDEISL